MSRRTRGLLVCGILVVLLSCSIGLLLFRKTASEVISQARSVANGPFLGSGSPRIVSRGNQRGVVVRKQPEDRDDELAEHDADAYLEERRRNQTVSSSSEIKASLAATSASAPAFNWVNLGPAKPTGGLAGLSGKLQAFAWEPTHPQVMYAGGGLGSGDEGPFTQAGAFKTVDSGSTWTPINRGLFDTTVNVMWINQSNPAVLLTGTEFGGLFRTTDGGQLWTQVSPDAPVSAIVTAAGGILVGTAAGFEFSNDGGATWNVVQKTPATVRCLAVNGTDIMAGLQNGDVLWKGPSDQTGTNSCVEPTTPRF